MDGDWNLKGCGRDDPSRFRTVDDVVRKIHETGFLSFFSTAIPGFSVEEHTCAWDWWTDDPATDPWNWRMEIAARDDIAYGKFFDRKAGFIAKEWFPVFANYRRDGYDFEGLYQDGKMKNQAKRILDALELNEDAIGLELMSGQLRKKAGVEKGFDNVLVFAAVEGISLAVMLLFPDSIFDRFKFQQWYAHVIVAALCILSGVNKYWHETGTHQSEEKSGGENESEPD